MSFEFAGLQTFVDDELKDGTVRLLEAGCGSASNIRFGENVRITGIDISKKQLERNSVLDERILGDIQSYPFKPESFDAIVCWDVLEHLPQPKRALRQFARAVKPGGIVILKLPNVLSVKGLITKFFPHYFHVLAYRYFYGNKDAGKEDTAPFKTFLRFSIAADAIKRFCAGDGLQAVFYGTLDVSNVRWLQNKKVALYSYLTLKALSRYLSFGAIGDSDFVLILRKMERAELNLAGIRQIAVPEAALSKGSSRANS
ncbi:MAG TPA: class I SAM-dependent methyltransferase [Candidatus Sulfotelmatobacter sp.]|nr:class I SAM-dependent methyltransferase [Candidatus Sulfotelmatobacter sp.]